MSFNGSGKVLTLWGEWRSQLEITSLEKLGYGASNQEKDSIWLELVVIVDMTAESGQEVVKLKIEWQSIAGDKYCEVRLAIECLEKGNPLNYSVNNATLGEWRRWHSLLAAPIERKNFYPIKSSFSDNLNALSSILPNELQGSARPGVPRPFVNRNAAYP